VSAAIARRLPAAATAQEQPDRGHADERGRHAAVAGAAATALVGRPAHTAGAAAGVAALEAVGAGAVGAGRAREGAQRLLRRRRALAGLALRAVGALAADAAGRERIGDAGALEAGPALGARVVGVARVELGHVLEDEGLLGVGPGVGAELLTVLVAEGGHADLPLLAVDRGERRAARVADALALARDLREAQEIGVGATADRARHRGLIDHPLGAGAVGVRAAGDAVADHGDRDPDRGLGWVEVDARRSAVGDRCGQADQPDVVHAEVVEVEARVLEDLAGPNHRALGLEDVDGVEVDAQARGDLGLALTDHVGVDAVSRGEDPVLGQERAGAQAAADLQRDDVRELTDRGVGAADDRGLGRPGEGRRGEGAGGEDQTGDPHARMLPQLAVRAHGGAANHRWQCCDDPASNHSPPGAPSIPRRIPGAPGDHGEVHARVRRGPWNAAGATGRERARRRRGHRTAVAGVHPRAGGAGRRDRRRGASPRPTCAARAVSPPVRDVGAVRLSGAVGGLRCGRGAPGVASCRRRQPDGSGGPGGRGGAGDRPRSRCRGPGPVRGGLNGPEPGALPVDDDLAGAADLVDRDLDDRGAADGVATLERERRALHPAHAAALAVGGAVAGAGADDDAGAGVVRLDVGDRGGQRARAAGGRRLVGGRRRRPADALRLARHAAPRRWGRLGGRVVDRRDRGEVAEERHLVREVGLPHLGAALEGDLQIEVGAVEAALQVDVDEVGALVEVGQLALLLLLVDVVGVGVGPDQHLVVRVEDLERDVHLLVTARHELEVEGDRARAGHGQAVPAGPLEVGVVELARDLGLELLIELDRLGLGPGSRLLALVPAVLGHLLAAAGRRTGGGQGHRDQQWGSTHGRTISPRSEGITRRSWQIRKSPVNFGTSACVRNLPYQISHVG
jgi:hypothetical protein